MNTIVSRFLLVFVGLMIGGEAAQAFPLPPTGTQPAVEPAIWSNRDSHIDFSGIIALSNCSGSLVRFETSLVTDKALVLTNGHCVGNYLEPGEVVVNVPNVRAITLMDSDGRSLGSLKTTTLMYATMTKTDMALYQLEKSYAEIEAEFGVSPLILSSKPPVAGMPIAIASGYWKTLYSCTIEKVVHSLREGQWSFRASMRYSSPGCETKGGTSGSPIIDPVSREVIAVNNTATEGGTECGVNNPCEVDANGRITTTPKRGYAQQIYWIHNCISARHEIQLDRAGCELPKP